MRWMLTVLREIWGLFVDDGSFAAAIVLWVGLMWWLEQWGRVPNRVLGMLLFVGLGLILIESLLRFARERGRAKD